MDNTDQDFYMCARSQLGSQNSKDKAVCFKSSKGSQRSTTSNRRDRKPGLITQGRSDETGKDKFNILLHNVDTLRNKKLS